MIEILEKVKFDLEEADKNFGGNTSIYNVNGICYYLGKHIPIMSPLYDKIISLIKEVNNVVEANGYWFWWVIKESNLYRPNHLYIEPKDWYKVRIKAVEDTINFIKYLDEKK